MLGFVPGEDKKLADWAQVLAYLKALAVASDRVKLEANQFATAGWNSERLGDRGVRRGASAPRLTAEAEADGECRSTLFGSRRVKAASIWRRIGFWSPSGS